MKSKPLLILTTVGKKRDATRLAERLVSSKLAACVTILPAAESRYVWKGKTCLEKEFVLLIKSLTRVYPKLEKFLKSIHPYECPEIVALPLQRAYAPYLQWLNAGIK